MPVKRGQTLTRGLLSNKASASISGFWSANWKYFLIAGIIIVLFLVIFLPVYFLVIGKDSSNSGGSGGGSTPTTPGIPTQPTPTKPLPPPKTPIKQWFTAEHFNKVFPYSFATSVFTPDGSPFYTYDGFMNAIAFLESLPNTKMHAFCTASNDQRINMNEMAAFLGNMQQETGDPSLVVPYPWHCPNTGTQTCVKDGDQCGGSGYVGPTNCCFSNSKCTSSGAFYSGCQNQGGAPDGRKSGGGIFLVEGVLELIQSTPLANNKPVNITNQTVSDALGCTTMYINGGTITPNTNRGLFFTGNPPKFAPTDGGCVMQGGYTCVSSNGTIYGDATYVDNQTSPYKNLFPVKVLHSTCANGDGSCSCVSDDLTCEYVGRGPTQLTGNINYQSCSLALFGDLRLIKYPNLLNTIDLNNYQNNGGTFYTNEQKNKLFGMPGNNIPPEIINSTPDARILIWATNIWFWMDTCRSGRTMSCHQCMLDPTNYGISAVGCLVNANPACGATQSYTKYLYYKSICTILGVESYDPVCTQNISSCTLNNTLGNKCPS